MSKLAANAAALRGQLAHEGFDVSGSRTQIVPLVVGDAGLAMKICEAALTRGVFAQAIRPPTVPPMTSRLRLAVMASHREEELRTAARILGSSRPRRRLRAAARPAASAAAAAQGPAEPTGARRPDTDARAASNDDAPPPPRAGVFDFEAPEKRAA